MAINSTVKRSIFYLNIALQEVYEYLSHPYTTNLPESYELVAKWQAIVDSYTNAEEKPRPRYVFHVDVILHSNLKCYELCYIRHVQDSDSQRIFVLGLGTNHLTK